MKTCPRIGNVSSRTLSLSTSKRFKSSKAWLTLLMFRSSLWHSRRLASPVVYGQPTAKELSQKPPAFHKLVQVAPDGRKTLYLAAHAKKIVGKSLEESQELIWELIRHCTQPKVSEPK